MAGKKGATRTKTIKDMGKVKKEAARLAKKYGWTTKEFLEYSLRMGVNRCLALERAEKSGGGKAKPSRKAKKSKSRKASAARKPRAAAAASTNAVAPAASAS